jgi:hypothetical protein
VAPPRRIAVMIVMIPFHPCLAGDSSGRTKKVSRDRSGLGPIVALDAREPRRKRGKPGRAADSPNRRALGADTQQTFLTAPQHA